MNKLVFLVEHLDDLFVGQGKELLLHRQQIELVLENVCRFRSKLMLKFSLMWVQAIEHKVQVEEQLQLQQQP